MRNGGFDVIIGNPPYIAMSKIRKEYTLRDFKTIKCSDVYALVQERCVQLLAYHGQCGMIVPLSLSFSGDFQSIRDMLYVEYDLNWFSSFARIPAALFSAEVRVRNVIHIGRRQPSLAKRCYTTILHRWFEEYRPNLIPMIAYTSFDAKCFNGLVTKVNTQRLTDAFQAFLRRTPKRINDYCVDNSNQYLLNYKKTAYNWLNFCKSLPPCFDKNGISIDHTEFGKIVLVKKYGNIIYCFLNGKISFAYWLMVGDDFHVTRWNFASLPFDVSMLTPQQIEAINAMSKELDRAIKENVSYKQNAGKRVGNYNLARCRHVTDCTDHIFAKAFGFIDAWDDIELLYSQVIKTDFSDHVSE